VDLRAKFRGRTSCHSEVIGGRKLATLKHSIDYKIRAKNFNSLQSYVRTRKTRKQQKRFWGDIIACWIPD